MAVSVLDATGVVRKGMSIAMASIARKIQFALLPRGGWLRRRGLRIKGKPEPRIRLRGR